MRLLWRYPPRRAGEVSTPRAEVDCIAAISRHKITCSIYTSALHYGWGLFEMHLVSFVKCWMHKCDHHYFIEHIMKNWCPVVWGELLEQFCFRTGWVRRTHKCLYPSLGQYWEVFALSSHFPKSCVCELQQQNSNRDRVGLLLALQSNASLSSVSPFWLLSFSGWSHGILKLWAQLDSPWELCLII